MPARLSALALLGLTAEFVTVEVDLAQGLPSFTIVGLPDKAVGEARERVRAAIKNSGFQFPVHRITVNLAPADVPKIGPAFDLPIALAILLANGIISADILTDVVSVGELSLSGEIRPVDGILPMTLSMRDQHLKGFILPKDNLREARLVRRVPLIPVSHLHTLVEDLQQRVLPIDTATDNDHAPAIVTDSESDFAIVNGLSQVKRALEVAAAGGHNVLLIGPPGTGKTLLARAFQSILPELTEDEYIEALTIRSAAGVLRSDDLTTRIRPVRSPHHTASSVALVGGGSQCKPGEVSLAHRGVLFLDEFPEFSRDVVEALREPLEEGKITIVRARGAVTFPARFLLLAAANPCPCGFFGDPERPCQCAPSHLFRYQRKLSGPLIDRLDIVSTVPRQKAEMLLGETVNTPSSVIRARVAAARSIQMERNDNILNSELSPRKVKNLKRSPEAQEILLLAGDKLQLSGRVLHRLLKVSRTIADLAEAEQIEREHIAEALQYRQTSLVSSIPD